MIFYSSLIIGHSASVGEAFCAVFEWCVCMSVGMRFLQRQIYSSAGSY